MEHSGKVQLWPLAGVAEISTDARKTGVGNRGQVPREQAGQDFPDIDCAPSDRFLQRRSTTDLDNDCPIERSVNEASKYDQLLFRKTLGVGNFSDGGKRWRCPENRISGCWTH